MKASNRTNPNLLQLQIISKKTEWQKLINLLKDHAKDDTVFDDFYTILSAVVEDGELSADSREYEASDDSEPDIRHGIRK